MRKWRWGESEPVAPSDQDGDGVIDSEDCAPQDRTKFNFVSTIAVLILMATDWLSMLKVAFVLEIAFPTLTDSKQ